MMTDSQLLKKLVFIRREIHKNPELGNQEFKTAQFVEKILQQIRVPYKRVSKTGIVATLNPQSSIRNSQSKCIALRADMDALPLTEKTGKSYRSQSLGVMHACGHDAHVAMLLGAVMILSEKKDFQGTIKFLFQPNEEGAGGAKQLIQSGAFKNPRIEAVFGLHVNPRLPAGRVGLKSGPLMAAVDRFTVEIIGHGGHAAYPHEGVDTIPIASEIIQSLQTISSRKTDPLEPIVVTVGTVSGGTRFNILAEKVVLTGTVRTLSEDLHRQVPQMIRSMVAGICQAHGAQFKINYEILGSVLSNSSNMTELAKKTAINLFGKESVCELSRASMGGEDFAEYLKLSPGCFIYLGTGPSEKESKKRNLIPWHHPEFDINERVLPMGAKLLAGLARDFLRGQEAKHSRPSG